LEVQRKGSAGKGAGTAKPHHTAQGESDVHDDDDDDDDDDVIIA